MHHYLVCVGGYDKEEKAARAYDLAALKYWGTSTTTNFPVFFYAYIDSFLYKSSNKKRLGHARARLIMLVVADQ